MKSTESELSGVAVRSLLAAALLILGLRLAVGWGHLQALDGEPDAGMKLALGVMGLGFLACGVLAVARVRTAASGLFALYCLSQAVHWGGPPSTRLVVWLVYFVISMLGISAVLHFTLLFPSRWPLAGRRSTQLFLHLPILVAAILAGARMATEGPLGETLQTAFLALEVIQVNLYALLAAVVIAVRFASASQPERRATGLGMMLAGALIGQLPYVIASLAAPDMAQVMTLLFVLGPIAITYAILKVGVSSASDLR